MWTHACGVDTNSFVSISTAGVAIFQPLKGKFNYELCLRVRAKQLVLDKSLLLFSGRILIEQKKKKFIIVKWDNWIENL